MMYDGAKGDEFTFLRCEHCETVFLANPVAPDKLGEYYPDYYLPYQGEKAWGKYGKIVAHQDQALNNRRVNLVKRFLKHSLHPPVVKVLDIGCGKPDFLAQFHQRIASECHGIDFTSAHWHEPNYKSLHLVEGDWASHQTDEQWDVITAWHYLEHDYNPVSTIAKCYDCLKPGGLLVIEVPMYQGILAKMQKQYWQGWHTPRHLTLFSFQSWELLFPSTQWNILQHQKHGTMDAFILWWLGESERKNIHWNTSFEHHFWKLVMYKILSWPFFILEKLIPMGIQTIVVQKK
jgi:ubiquinone/menaquinone biosynthesis C-methylase UbiE